MDESDSDDGDPCCRRCGKIMDLVYECRHCQREQVSQFSSPQPPSSSPEAHDTQRRKQEHRKEVKNAKTQMRRAQRESKRLFDQLQSEKEKTAEQRQFKEEEREDRISAQEECKAIRRQLAESKREVADLNRQLNESKSEEEVTVTVSTSRKRRKVEKQKRRKSKGQSGRKKKKGQSLGEQTTATLESSMIESDDHWRARRLLHFFIGEFEAAVQPNYQPLGKVKQIMRTRVANKEKGKKKADRDYAYFQRTYKVGPFNPSVCYGFWLDMGMRLVLANEKTAFEMTKMKPANEADGTSSMWHIKLGTLSSESREALIDGLFT